MATRSRWRASPPDPVRRRSRGDPPRPHRPHPGPNDPRSALRPDDRQGGGEGLVFSYGGNPGVGSLHFRDAIENGWPRPLEVEEHSHAGMANRYAASAAGLPMAIMRGYVGTDLMEHTRIREIECPFSGEKLVAVPAQDLDVAIVHAQEADRDGNVQLWGIARGAEGSGAGGAGPCWLGTKWGTKPHVAQPIPAKPDLAETA